MVINCLRTLQALTSLISGSRPVWLSFPSDYWGKMDFRDANSLYESLGKEREKRLGPTNRRG